MSFEPRDYLRHIQIEMNGPKMRQITGHRCSDLRSRRRISVRR